MDRAHLKLWNKIRDTDKQIYSTEDKLKWLYHGLTELKAKCNHPPEAIVRDDGFNRCAICGYMV